MENCKDVFALLSQYLDRELPEDICEKMAQHINDCAPCVEFVSSLKQSIALCRNFQESEEPAPLPEETKNRLLEAYRKAAGV